MKYKLLLSLVIIFMIWCFGAASLYAQEVPITINYQSVIRDVSGKPAISNPITVTATLCADANCNTELWQEIFPTKTNQLGIVNIQLGKTVQIDQKFFNPIIYPKVYIRLRNDVGGTVLEEITEFSTVPYSVVSNKAIDMYIDELKDVNTQGSKSVGDVLSWNGNNWVVGTVNVNAMLPGAGIEIIGTTIFNVGDIDSTNDITITTPATGDLGGFYPSPTVKAIQGLPVSAIPPGVNMILKWNGSQWVPSIDENTQNIYLAGAGISILGNTIVNSGDLDPADDITNTTSATGDLAGIYPSPTVSGLQGRTVSGAAPALNQVLKWNGTSWAPAEDIDTDTNTDTNTEYDAGTGISIIGTTITNTGDLDPSNDITNSTSATGDLSGTFPSPTVSGLQGRTVSGAAPALNQVLKWNGTAWVPAEDIDTDTDTNTEYDAGTGISIIGTTITNTGDLDPSNDITNSTSATGDLAGIYPSPTVSGLQGRTVSGAAPALNQVLKWNGTSWAPAEDIDTDTNTDTNTEYDAGTGISIIGTTITNTGDLDPSNDITNTTTATGDLAGTYPSPTVSGLQGRTVSGATPALNQVLKWNGTSWAPAEDIDTDTDTNTEYEAGTGITISGDTIYSTGDLDPSDDVTSSTTAAGDLAGTYPSPTVGGIQGRTVDGSAPALNQILKWNGTSWAPAEDIDTDTDTNTEYEAGTGIMISGDTIYSTGDLDPSDDITSSTAAAGDLTGTYPAPTISNLQGNPLLASAPDSGDIIMFNGINWISIPDPGAIEYVAGIGIDIVNDTINYTVWNLLNNDVFRNSGKVGIGTNDPQAGIHLVDSFGALFEGQVGGTISKEGAGRRMLWYPQKSAFRVGEVTGTHWDDANTGINSIAMGYNTTASGIRSIAIGSATLSNANNGTAIGRNTNATGDSATAVGNKTSASGQSASAFGYGNNANGQGASAFGYESLASGSFSNVLGFQSNASGPYSIAMGYRGFAGGTYSIAIGHTAWALGQGSLAFGNETNVTGNYSTAFGYKTNVSGKYSIAAGISAKASGDSSIALGFNTLSSGDNAFSAGYNAIAAGNNTFALGRNVEADTTIVGSFVLGDASSGASFLESQVNNEFASRFTGGYRFFTSSDLSSGVTLPGGGGSWSILSDRRMKENIREVNAEETLLKIRDLEITNWNYISQDDKIRHIGPYAQDFFKAFQIGESDTTITTSDIDGINMLAIKALEQRTNELRLKQLELEKAQIEFSNARKEIDNLKLQIQNQNSINTNLSSEIQSIKEMLEQQSSTIKK